MKTLRKLISCIQVSGLCSDNKPVYHSLLSSEVRGREQLLVDREIKNRRFDTINVNYIELLCNAYMICKLSSILPHNCDRRGDVKSNASRIFLMWNQFETVLTHFEAVMFSEAGLNNEHIRKRIHRLLQENETICTSTRGRSQSDCENAL